MSIRRKSERAGEGRNGAGSQFSMNKTFIDICICRRKFRASATNNKMKQVPERKKKKTRPENGRKENRASGESLTSPISKGLPVQPSRDVCVFMQPREE